MRVENSGSHVPEQLQDEVSECFPVTRGRRIIRRNNASSCSVVTMRLPGAGKIVSEFVSSSSPLVDPAHARLHFLHKEARGAGFTTDNPTPPSMCFEASVLFSN